LFEKVNRTAIYRVGKMVIIDSQYSSILKAVEFILELWANRFLCYRLALAGRERGAAAKD
jgi:hypothetical protein